MWNKRTCGIEACWNVSYIRPCRTKVTISSQALKLCSECRSCGLYIYIYADGDVALREDRWCLLLFLCLRAKRITCAFSVCSVFFVPHGNEKHVVTNTLIFVYMNRLWPSVFRIRLYAIFSPNETRGSTVMYCSNSRKPITIAYVFTRENCRKPKMYSVWVCVCIPPDMLKICSVSVSFSGCKLSTCCARNQNFLIKCSYESSIVSTVGCEVRLRTNFYIPYLNWTSHKIIVTHKRYSLTTKYRRYWARFRNEETDVFKWFYLPIPLIEIFRFDNLRTIFSSHSAWWPI